MFLLNLCLLTKMGARDCALYPIQGRKSRQRDNAIDDPIPGQKIDLGKKSLEGARLGNFLLVLVMLYEDSSLKKKKKASKTLTRL